MKTNIIYIGSACFFTYKFIYALFSGSRRGLVWGSVSFGAEIPETRFSGDLYLKTAESAKNTALSMACWYPSKTRDTALFKKHFCIILHVYDFSVMPSKLHNGISLLFYRSFFVRFIGCLNFRHIFDVRQISLHRFCAKKRTSLKSQRSFLKTI